SSRPRPFIAPPLTDPERADRADKDWYVLSAVGESVGPVTLDLLARGISAGRVARDAAVGRAGARQWTPATDLPQVVEAVRKAEPLPPPPAATAPVRTTADAPTSLATTAVVPPSVPPAAVNTTPSLQSLIAATPTPTPVVVPEVSRTLVMPTPVPPQVAPA